MKHAYTDSQLQAAIDGAFRASQTSQLATVYQGALWNEQRKQRFELAHAFLNSLPKPHPPTVDGKTPGEFYNELARKEEGQRFMEWRQFSEEDKIAENKRLAAVLAAFGNQPQPAEIPWTEWHGGECPLKDEEVEEWEHKLRNGFHCERPGRPSCYRIYWIHDNNSYDTTHYRVLKWRKGFGPSSLIAEHKALTADEWAERWQAEADARNVQFKELQDWKTKFEDAEKNLRAKFEPEVKEANARAEKAEAELAQSEAAFSNYRGVILSALNKAGAPTHHKDIGAPALKPMMPQERIKALSTLSQLRPIAEAGPVPEGCVRYYFEARPNGVFTKYIDGQATHFADIQLPAAKADDSVKPDPYADEPTLEPLQTEPEPWTPKVGDVVTLKSGGPKMVINHISDEGVYCSWFNESEVLIKTHIKALPTACLQPA